MSRTDRPPVEYAGEYFFESYRKQYGKTYLEDFPNLMAMGEKRLSRIVPLVPAVPGKAKLLDIGCAYGPFLKAASHAGFEVLGLDPAEEAAAYVRDTLKLPAVRGLFPPPKDGAPGEDAGMYAPGTYSVGMYSVITLWYVIEHMRNPGEALAEARRLLMDGGVLAFSTPSFAGISGKKSPAAFLEKSPQDHWTIWAPRICGRILRRQGFALKKIVVSGHHPERFPLAGKLCAAKRGPVYQFLLLLSRIFGLGDTFEVYAVKIPQKPGKERT
jgi:2-polyprenyl-3-methyl-5-hydroxy-6-metoxy-1,4-benzoquinol methylase